MKAKFLLFISVILFLFSTGCSDKKENPVPEVPANEFILPDPPQYGAPFQDIPATEDVVMYEVNLRAFSPANLNGVIAKLDHIRSLGVNVIWLMPVFPIGSVNSVNSPYCVRNYREVNQEFGTLADMRRLTDEAHSRGMAVILDWVANHTSWDNPWLKYQSWYTRENGQVIHPAGTNWEDVADLNFDSPDMRKAMISALKYWILDANIDGYRCDAADMVPFEFWKQAIDSLNGIPGRNVIMLAEGARSDHFTAGFSMNYAWDFYGKLKSVFSGQAASALFTTHASEYSSIPAGKHKLRFTTNHDESAWDATPVTLFGGIEGALAASAIAVYMGGVPLFYGSQEVGRAATLPFFTNTTLDWNANPDMLTAYRSMMEFYTGSEAARKGSLVSYPYADACVFTKTSGTEEILVMVNVRNSAISIDFTPGEGTIYSDVFMGTPIDREHNTVTLEPFQYVIARKIR